MNIFHFPNRLDFQLFLPPKLYVLPRHLLNSAKKHTVFALPDSSSVPVRNQHHDGAGQGLPNRHLERRAPFL